VFVDLGERLNRFIDHRDYLGGLRPIFGIFIAALLLPASISAQAFAPDASAALVSLEEPGAPDADAGLSHPDLASPENAVQAKRLFGLIPNYRADQKTNRYQPLTVAEKFKIAREDSFDWPNFPLLAGYALQAQVASGGFHQNGGFRGFGEFYARGVGDQVIGSYLTEAILPSLLHEDPRYFRSGTGTFWRRVSYAASRVVVTHADNGRARFFVSEVAGNAAVVAATSLYYPNSQSAAEGAKRYTMQLGNDAVSNILSEFWPDIRIRLRFVRHYLFAH
jgi:hypothetical protein